MKQKTCKLLVSKSKNVKEYWKLLKQSANLNDKCSIDAKKFSEYFQSISDPNDRFYISTKDICRENFKKCLKNLIYQFRWKKLKRGYVSYETVQVPGLIYF